MIEAIIENGFAKVEAGAWLCGYAQPAACAGAVVTRGLRGIVVPDRGWLTKAEVSDRAWFSCADSPFLTRLDALPDESLHVVSSKILLAPLSSRVGASTLKIVPLSFNRSTPITEFRMGWVVAATRSRVTRVAIGDGETLTVRPEALVAWTGNRPTGFCPKLKLLDMILPRGPKNLAYSFHGPAVVWFDGSSPLHPFTPSPFHPFTPSPFHPSRRCA